mmetsp:Transcript_48032/g.134075  ORF Transcript_48032/g.134075 Transcript_48032/m.134075 type:complete len:267 (-) Transcript_48032:1609-2409(-)
MIRSAGLQHVIRNDHGWIREESFRLKVLEVLVESGAALIHEDQVDAAGAILVQHDLHSVVRVAELNSHNVRQPGELDVVSRDRRVHGVHLHRDDFPSPLPQLQGEPRGRVTDVRPELEHESWPVLEDNVVDDTCLLAASHLQPNLFQPHVLDCGVDRAHVAGSRRGNDRLQHAGLLVVEVFEARLTLWAPADRNVDYLRGLDVLKPQLHSAGNLLRHASAQASPDQLAQELRGSLAIPDINQRHHGAVQARCPKRPRVEVGSHLFP